MITHMYIYIYIYIRIYIYIYIYISKMYVLYDYNKEPSGISVVLLAGSTFHFCFADAGRFARISPYL